MNKTDHFSVELFLINALVSPVAISLHLSTILIGGDEMGLCSNTSYLNVRCVWFKC
jgi:hypothetical protein